MLNNILKISLLLSVTSVRVGASILYSNDTMSLTLSSNTRNLLSSLSSSHSLEWILSNTGGSPGTFLLTQHSPHGVKGRILTPTVSLSSGQFASVRVDNIIVPAFSPTNSVFTLIVNKVDASQREKERLAPGYIDTVSSSVILNLVPGPVEEEREWPVAVMWVEQDACSHVTTCHDAHWMVEFHVQDTGSGLFRVGLQSQVVQRPTRLHMCLNDQFRTRWRRAQDYSGGMTS